jgi:hypothetical protein
LLQLCQLAGQPAGPLRRRFGRIFRVREVDWIPVLPDGEAVAGIQIPIGVFVLAEMLVNVKNPANFAQWQ